MIMNLYTNMGIFVKDIVLSKVGGILFEVGEPEDNLIVLLQLGFCKSKSKFVPCTKKYVKASTFSKEYEFVE